jgi:hypothetical protein
MSGSDKTTLPNIASFSTIEQTDGGTLIAQTSGGLLNGLGIAFKPPAQLYKGYYRHGTFQGLGILKIGQDHSYCGDFIQGKASGFGLLRRGQDLVFGEFDFETLTGVGSYSRPNIQYQGSFKSGAIDGFGKFDDKTSSTAYIGYFQRGMYSGVGKLTTPTEAFTGSFANGKRTGVGHSTSTTNGEEYRGYWSNDRREAFGRHQTADGRVYVGEWRQDKEHGVAFVEHRSKKFVYLGEMVDGQRSGLGRLEHSSLTYTGRWKDHKKEGLGVETSSDGSVYFGHWKDNKKEGLGRETGPNINYRGEWKAGVPHGKGILITGKDSQVCVKFENGQITQTLQQSDVEAIEKEFAAMDCEKFKSDVDTKLKDYQRQINTSAKQLDDRLEGLVPNFESETSKFEAQMDAIQGKAQAKVKAAKEIEKVTDWVTSEFAKKGVVLESAKGKSSGMPDVLKKDANKRNTQLIKILPETSKADLRSKSKSSSIEPLREPAQPRKTIKRENSLSVEKQDEVPQKLEEQALRFDAYERWLIKETKNINAIKSTKKNYQPNAEYSTKEMQDAEKQKIKDTLADEFEKLEAERNELQNEVKHLKEKVSKLEKHNRQLENYNNDVDKRNFGVKLAMEGLRIANINQAEEFHGELSKNKAYCHKLEHVIQIRDKEIERIDNELLNTRDEADKKDKKIDFLKEKLDDLHHRYTRTLVQIHVLKLSQQNFEKKSIEKSEIIDSLRSQIASLTQNLEISTKESETLKTQHASELQALVDVHEARLKELDVEKIKTAEDHQIEIDRLKRQIRTLETGGKVDDTDEQLRQRELADNKAAMQRAVDDASSMKQRIAALESEVSRLTAVANNKEKVAKDVTAAKHDLEVKVAVLEDTVRGYVAKQEEWSEMKDALTNNIKILMEREMELKNEIQSKKTMEKQELAKRTEKLSKDFFDDTIKPKVLMNLGRLVSQR